MDSVTDRNKKVSFTITITERGGWLFLTHLTAFALGGVILPALRELF